MKNKKCIKKRDQNILSSIKREINLNTKIVKDKTIYTRKQKHKHEFYISHE